MNGIIMQCKMEVLRILRNPYYIFWSLCMPIGFYFVFTNIFNFDTVDQYVWQAHYLMSMTTFSVLGTSIMTLGIRLVEEKAQGWSMFMRITPLSDHAYFFAKMFGQTVIHLFSIIVIFTAGAIMNNVSLTAFEWVMSALWILFGSLPFLAIGTLIGMMKKVDTASGVSNMIYLLLAVLGGMWMPLDTMPTILQTIGSWLPSYHFGSGVWEIVRGGSPSWLNFLIIIGYLFFFMIISNYIRRKQEVAV